MCGAVGSWHAASTGTAAVTISAKLVFLTFTSRARSSALRWRQGVHAGPGAAYDPVGSVMLQPVASPGTNVAVLGLAKSAGDPGFSAPRESAMVLVHVVVEVSADERAGSLMTRNFADGGRVRQADGVVTRPMSRLQYPPGVSGWSLGKARTSSESQPPA